jgi:4-amino-4-deoxy-L-arabinose transferase-like glycosyltransferase
MENMKSLLWGFNKLELAIITSIIILIFMLGAMTDIMDVDAGQYAALSRQMLETKGYLVLKDRAEDYLDKPPFLFWISAFSIKLFGVSSWSYKLPSILFSLLGIFSTFSLGRLLYNEKTGLLAAIMLSSCQAVFLMNQDVRTDNILTALIAFSLWQIYAYLQKEKIMNLVLGFTGIGMSMLTKGPIGLMMPVFALSTHFIYTRQWRLFLKWEWLLGVLIVSVLLVPMCIGLYTQFGTEGLYFYFWKQSFGRITGENSWRNDTTILFFTHTFLWAFLPWSLLFIFAFFNRTWELLKSKIIVSTNEALTWGGFILTFIAFSLSKYKLPHYIFITFPLAAILSASWIIRLEETKQIKWLKAMSKLQAFVSVLLFTGSMLLIKVLPPDFILNWYLLFLLLFWCSVSCYLSKDYVRKIVFSVLYAILFVNIVMNGSFYPQLLGYQSSSVAGKLFYEKHQAGEKLYFLNSGWHTLDYYGRIISQPYTDEIRSHAWIYTNEAGLKSLKEKGVFMNEILGLRNFSVQFLSFKFLNPKTRDSTLEKNYLIHL